jgi:hypothetical protein
VRPSARGRRSEDKAGAREKSSTAVRSETLARAPQRTAQMRIGPSRARRAHLPPPPVPTYMPAPPRERAGAAGRHQAVGQPTHRRGHSPEPSASSISASRRSDPGKLSRWGCCLPARSPLPPHPPPPLALDYESAFPSPTASPAPAAKLASHHLLLPPPVSFLAPSAPPGHPSYK